VALEPIWVGHGWFRGNKIEEFFNDLNKKFLGKIFNGFALKLYENSSFLSAQIQVFMI
jgi:hypothetical protein